MRHKNIFFAISLFFVVPSIISLIIFGLKPNIDFTGGSLLEVKVGENKEEFSSTVLQPKLEAIYQLESVQSSENNQLILRGSQINNDQKEQILNVLQENDPQIEEVKFESIGPTLGQELVAETLAAVLILSLLIIVYVWRQFNDIKFGVCAILGMFHDTIILLGSFSLLGHFLGIQVDVLFVTALLTTLSFSIHDTIVIYNRIRELKKNKPKLSLKQIANLAIWETLARSINNSMTIIFMLAALVLLGGATIRWFAVALLIGAIAGTYSSTFTAVPLLVLWEEIKNKKK
ncbi:MAG: protein translocase subunit SecF [Patescibacteria group bacterium]|nr:protein translocase subunit SecF [Patescibacteria group bacterium]